MQFQIVLEGKAFKEIPLITKLEFSEKFSPNNFALSDVEDNTSRSNRGIIADLPLLRILLAICQKSHELGGDEIFCFVST